ncbi:HET-domain-containing protein [Hypoxylon argillaceum]|nr:HET-domain-containing protein [Hypoxylon argillaceum]
MRLINVNSMLLEEFYGDDIPRYAILSHTWGHEEVSYQDWQNPQVALSKAGFDKIEGACKKAQSHSLDYLWVDTNCIDKTSSAELSEAINSMYQWYAKSDICYAYLSDVTDFWSISQFPKSRWFIRGWTLQELLAPRKLAFYTADWSKIGSRGGSLVTDVSSVTGISEDILTRPHLARTASVGRRMS